MSFGKSLASSLLAFTAATAAHADVPQVATDIAPVHGLVARVMDGLGEPELVVQPGASPHSYSMRPSEARALEQSDAVFWIGAELEPWLEESIGTLASGARVIELLDVDGISTLEFREGVTFEAHDHGGEDHADHDHGHGGEDHAGHDHEGEEHDGHDHAGHNHEGVDPHAWLDPENAKVWLDVIAEELAELDPENAEAYRENAATGREEIDATMAEVEDTISAAGEISFVVFHDAYHYFENRFGISAAGAISLSDATDPSPARVEEVRDTIRDLGVACVFAEPQFDQKLVATVSEGTDAQAAVIDPLGFELDMGPGFYPALVRSIGDRIANCTGSS